MEKMKMLGVVTLYSPERGQALQNIGRYAPCIDLLMVWDNSPESHAEWFQDHANVQYCWTGRNTFIAPALNQALRLAKADGYQTILLMDQDSQWDDFAAYRSDIETTLQEGRVMVFTPYVSGCDAFTIASHEQAKRLFINSGTVIPTSVLEAIGGADEAAFPLDALDHDLSLSMAEHGYKIVCLTRHVLNHSLGQPQRMGPFRLFTPNYNRHRTYSMTRSHIICYRKHRSLMTAEDRDYLFNEILRRKFFRIVLAEPDKLGRLSALLRGIIGGCLYKIEKNV